MCFISQSTKYLEKFISDCMVFPYLQNHVNLSVLDAHIFYCDYKAVMENDSTSKICIIT